MLDQGYQQNGKESLPSNTNTDYPVRHLILSLVPEKGIFDCNVSFQQSMQSTDILLIEAQILIY